MLSIKISSLMIYSSKLIYKIKIYLNSNLSKFSQLQQYNRNKL